MGNRTILVRQHPYPLEAVIPLKAVIHLDAVIRLDAVIQAQPESPYLVLLLPLSLRLPFRFAAHQGERTTAKYRDSGFARMTALDWLVSPAQT
jgi:hypothetical protein